MEARTVTGWRAVEDEKEERLGGYRGGKKTSWRGGWRIGGGRPVVPKATPEVIAKMKELRSQRWSIRKIAAEVGLSVQTVWKHT